MHVLVYSCCACVSVACVASLMPLLSISLCFPPLSSSTWRRAGVGISLAGRKAIKQCKMMQKWTEEYSFLWRGWELLEKNHNNAPIMMLPPPVVSVSTWLRIYAAICWSTCRRNHSCSFCVCKHLMGNIVRCAFKRADWLDFYAGYLFWLWGKLEQVEETHQGFCLLQPQQCGGEVEQTSKANSWFLFCFFTLSHKSFLKLKTRWSRPKTKHCFFPSDSQSLDIREASVHRNAFLKKKSSNCCTESGCVKKTTVDAK